jgi:hypothetical protein
VIPATTYGAAGQAPGAQFGVAAGAAAAEVDEREWLGDIAVDREDGAGTRLYVDYVVVSAAILVGVFEGNPLRREREPAIPAREIPEVSHTSSIAGSEPFGSHHEEGGGLCLDTEPSHRSWGPNKSIRPRRRRRLAIGALAAGGANDYEGDDAGSHQGDHGIGLE